MLATKIAEILKDKIRLVSVDGEPCAECGETVDYSFKVKDGCIDECSAAISELVFGAMARGDISVTVPKHS